MGQRTLVKNWVNTSSHWKNWNGGTCGPGVIFGNTHFFPCPFSNEDARYYNIQLQIGNFWNINLENTHKLAYFVKIHHKICKFNMNQMYLNGVWRHSALFDCVYLLVLLVVFFVQFDFVLSFEQTFKSHFTNGKCKWAQKQEILLHRLSIPQLPNGYIDSVLHALTFMSN